MKNYQLLVTAQTDAERRAAVETTPARKLREIRMALTLDKTFSKPEILTRYLNLVSFGNGAFGVQDAAQTYFGIDASDLNWQQAALLAGLVQSTTSLDPYTNPDGALQRRNLVLDTMIENFPAQAEALRAAKAEPLGILPQPQALPRGCIAAGNRAFFCDYVLDYLARAGISKEQVARGGYLIRTTLDPHVQDSVKQAIDGIASPTLDGVANVMSVIKPGKDSHRVMAMASNRTYGLNMEAGETMQPQPFSLVGDGAGSIFKIFTTAAALEMGMGINAQLEVPGRFEAKGMGTGGARGCPKDTWCVQNDGSYRGSMNVTEALATSPNTAFARLIQLIGVPRAVDMAVKLGLRSYAQPGTARAYDPESNESLADFVKRQNLGSFTLGPLELNPLELSNVAATLASGGMWCPPSPVAEIIDRHGDPVPITTESCEQVVPEGLANTLANAMSKDDQGNGTAAAFGRIRRMGRCRCRARPEPPRRTGPPGFVGFTNNYAAAVYIFDDSAEADRLVLVPAAPVRVRKPLRRQRAGAHLVLGDEADRQRLRRGEAAAHRPAVRRRRTGFASAQRVRAWGRDRQAAVARRRVRRRRPAGVREQHRSLRPGRRHHPERSDRSGRDRHCQHQQRHSTGPATAAARRAAGSGDRVDRGQHSRAAAHHRARAGAATAAGRRTAALAASGRDRQQVPGRRRQPLPAQLRPRLHRAERRALVLARSGCRRARSTARAALRASSTCP